MTYEHFIIPLVKKAGKAAQALFGKQAKATFKAPTDVVTEADFASEKIMVGGINGKFPAHSIWSEEGGGKKKDSDFCWYLDPIDGTNNFYMGLPFWGVSIGLYRKNTPLAGAMFFPLLNELYYAEKGKSAFLNGEKISVSGKKDTRQVLFIVDDPRAYDLFKAKSINSLSKNFFALRVFGSACYSYGLVARGIGGGCFHAQLKPGDFAAARLIMEEAGGRMEDLERKEVEVEKSTKILASNGKLHGKIRKLIRG